MKTKTKLIIFILLPVLCILCAITVVMAFDLNKTYTAEEIYTINADAIFEIHQETLSPDYQILHNVGTGFFIDSEGTAVTAYHVIHFLNTFDDSIILNDGRRFDIVEIYHADEINDIAIFRVNNPNNQIFTYLTLNTKKTPKEDDEIFTMGFVQDKFDYLGHGKILRYIKKKTTIDQDENIIRLKNKFESDVSVYPGNSGSPVIDNKNQVIGIVNAQLTSYDRINGIITPISVIDSTLKGLLRFTGTVH